MGGAIRIAVMGPPRAGKTSLARRLSLQVNTGEYVASQENELYYFKKDRKNFAFKVMQGSHSWNWDAQKNTKGIIYVMDCAWNQPETKEFEDKFNVAKAGLQIALSKLKEGPVLILANKWDQVPSNITLDKVKELIDFDSINSSQFKAPDVTIQIYTAAIFGADSVFGLNDGLNWFCSQFP